MLVVAAIVYQDLQRLRPVLDQLQEACVVVAPDGRVRWGNAQARRLLGGRRLQRGRAVDLLGEVCAELCHFEDSGGRALLWREIQIPAANGPLEVSVASLPIAFEDDQLGALLMLLDISVELALHRKYKQLLEEQRQVNRRLQREIAQELRAHEDDINQFSEILQLAPAIFSSFISEAHEAVAAVEALLNTAASSRSVQLAQRAMHTLKGNARSLGLNLIGGRAHAVEDLLRELTTSATAANAEVNEALGELAADLNRAVERAITIRQHLGELTAQSASSGAELQLYEVVSKVEVLVGEALADLAEEHPAYGRLAQARDIIAQDGHIPLQQLFDYLRMVIGRMGQEAPGGVPIIEMDDGGISVSPAVYGALAAALPHLLRNALVHGLESSDERRARGKAPVGTLRVIAVTADDTLWVRVCDDGRGLDLERLCTIAERNGLAAPQTPRDYAELLFLPGVSTASAVTLDAGRGVGTSASKSAVEAVGGDIELRLLEGGGTEFLLTLPYVAPASA